MIQVQCAGCGKRYAVPDNFGGKKMRCKQCSAVVEIPVSAPAPAASAPPEAARPPAPPEEPAREEAFQAAGPSEAEAPSVSAEKAPAPKALGQKKFPGKKVPSFKRPAAPLKGPKPAAAAPGKGFAVKKFQSKKLSLKPGADRGTVAAGDEETAAPAAADSKKKLFLFAGGAVALVAVAAAIYFLVSGGAPEPAVKKASSVAAKKAAPEESEEEKAAGAEAKGEIKAVNTAIPSAGDSKPLDPVAAFPADANFLLRVSFGQVANNESLRAQVEAMKSQEEMAKLIEESGFDPMTHLRAIWVAGSASAVPDAAAAAESMEGGMIFEGSFDTEKFLSGLKKNSVIGQNPRKQGSLEIYDVYKDKEKSGYMTFLTDEQLLLGSEAFFNKVIKVRDGGESLRSSKVFQDLTNDFNATNLIWAAFALTKEMKKSISDANKANEGKMPPIPDLEGGLLTVDPSSDGAGMALEVAARCASPQDVQKAQQWVSGLVLMAKGMAPAEAKPLLDPLLKKLKVSPEGDNLRVSLEIPGDMMKKMGEMAGQTLGLPQAGSEEEGEGEEGEEASAEEGTSEETPTEEAKEESAGEEKAAEETTSEEMTGDEKAAGKETEDEKEASAEPEEKAAEEEATEGTGKESSEEEPAEEKPGKE